MRPLRPGAAGGPAPAPATPSPRITILSLGLALGWALTLPALLEHAVPRRAGAPGWALDLMWSPTPHTAAAAAFLLLVLLRQGRWYRPWQSALLIAVSALYLVGVAVLLAAAWLGGDAPAR